MLALTDEYAEFEALDGNNWMTSDEDEKTRKGKRQEEKKRRQKEDERL